MSRAAPRFHRNNPSLPNPGSGAVVEIIVYGVVEEQEVINTFYYYCSTAGTLSQTDLTDCVNAWVAAFGTHYLAAVSSDYVGNQIIAQCLTQPSLASYVSTTWSGSAGTGPAGHEPTTVAAVISRYTATKGQHGRGRVYMPAVPTSWVVASSLVTTGQYATVAADLLLGFTANANTYVSAVVQRSKVSPRPVVGVAQITATTLRKVLGTVRRRRLGRGK